MKALISLVLVFALGVFLIGCNDAGTSPAPDKVVTDRVPVPFNGNWDGLAVTPDPQAYPIPKVVTCQGNSTHLGLFDAEVNYFVTYNALPPYTTGGDLLNGSAVMTSANGDKLYLTNLTGEWWFTGPSSVEFSAAGNVAGGTGRFADATGTFNGTGSQVFYIENIPQETSFSWTGSMDY